MYYYKFKDYSISLVSNDVMIVLNSYLADANNTPFYSNDNTIDVFDVITRKTSLPAPVDYDAYFEQLIAAYIKDKYSVSTTVTCTVGSNIITVPDTTNLYPDMLLNIDTAYFTAGTTVTSIINGTQAYVSTTALDPGSNLTTIFTTDYWVIDYGSASEVGSLYYFLSVVNLDNL